MNRSFAHSPGRRQWRLPRFAAPRLAVPFALLAALALSACVTLPPPTAELAAAQQAVANVREQADVVLYLVNAAEEPGDAGYLAPEMSVLEWIGKPVVVVEGSGENIKVTRPEDLVIGEAILRSRTTARSAG